jgi:hypothetical protein
MRARNRSNSHNCVANGSFQEGPDEDQFSKNPTRKPLPRKTIIMAKSRGKPSQMEVLALSVERTSSFPSGC